MVTVLVKLKGTPVAGASVTGTGQDALQKTNLTTQLTNSKGVATFSAGWPWGLHFVATSGLNVGTTTFNPPIIGNQQCEIDLVYSPGQTVDQTLEVWGSKATNDVIGLAVVAAVIVAGYYAVKKLGPTIKDTVSSAIKLLPLAI